jgi:hypothetical protein
MARDGLVNRYRRDALQCLQKMGDPSVIPQLDEILRSPDAERIEEELAQTIEHLQNRASEVK